MGKPCALLSLTPGRRLGWGGPGLRRGGWILWLDPAREGALGSGGCGREPERGSRACVGVNYRSVLCFCARSLHSLIYAQALAPRGGRPEWASLARYCP